MTQGMLIHVNGMVENVTINDYRDIQHAVGGCFDLVVSETGNTSFWLHDEGKLIGLPVNQTATVMLWQLNQNFVGRDVLVGPILVTGGADENGDDTDVGPEAIIALSKIA